ncbi:MAG: hypothetical protein ACK47B_01835 [Armatimonadota bacterium]
MTPIQPLAAPCTRREARFLFVLCTLDMVSSAGHFQSGLAVEASPLLRPGTIAADAAIYIVPPVAQWCS